MMNTMLRPAASDQGQLDVMHGKQAPCHLGDAVTSGILQVTLSEALQAQIVQVSLIALAISYLCICLSLHNFWHVGTNREWCLARPPDGLAGCQIW